MFSSILKKVCFTKHSFQKTNQSSSTEEPDEISTPLLLITCWKHVNNLVLHKGRWIMWIKKIIIHRVMHRRKRTEINNSQSLPHNPQPLLLLLLYLFIISIYIKEKLTLTNCELFLEVILWFLYVKNKNYKKVF